LQLTWLCLLQILVSGCGCLSVSQSVNCSLLRLPQLFLTFQFIKLKICALPEASHFTLDKNRANLVYFISPVLGGCSFSHFLVFLLGPTRQLKSKIQFCSFSPVFHAEGGTLKLTSGEANKMKLSILVQCTPNEME